MELINNIYDKYISISYGYEIQDKNTINQIKVLIGYMIDNKFSEKEILNYLIKNDTNITDDLFVDSLTQKNKFYYHNELRLMSKAPVWSPTKGQQTSKFYLEMKCRYTLDNLLDYYYSHTKVPMELRDNKQDTGAFKYLLEKYSHFKKWESIDYILALIDYAHYNEIHISKVFDLIDNADIVYTNLETLTQSTKYNKIIWRDYYDM